MCTVLETPTFSRLAIDVWGEAEQLEFIGWLAAFPDAGTVVPGSGGVRKVRWSRTAGDERGDVRVIYYNWPARNEIWLLLIYALGKDDSPV